MKLTNYLKACIINSYLSALLSPETYENLPNTPEFDVATDQGKANFANFLYEESQRSDNEMLREAIEANASLWSPAYILSIIRLNRRTSPFTMEEVSLATQAGQDVITFAKAATVDGTMAPGMMKAQMDIGAISNLRIEPEQLKQDGKELRKADSVGDLLNGTIDVEYVKKLLQSAYCDEILAYYQYVTVAPFLAGQERENIEKFFNSTAEDELLDHSRKLLNRLNELGGIPEAILDFSNIQSIANCKYLTPRLPLDLKEVLLQNIESEKCAIETYRKICEITKDKDLVTYKTARDIMSDEEQHITDLNDFLSDLK